MCGKTSVVPETELYNPQIVAEAFVFHSQNVTTSYIKGFVLPAVKPLLQRLAIDDKAAWVRPSGIICPQFQLLVQQLAHRVMQHRTLYGIAVAPNTCVHIEAYSKRSSQRMAVVHHSTTPT